jgi:hypothetical protein
MDTGVAKYGVISNEVTLKFRNVNCGIFCGRETRISSYALCILSASTSDFKRLLAR